MSVASRVNVTTPALALALGNADFAAGPSARTSKSAKKIISPTVAYMRLAEKQKKKLGMLQIRQSHQIEEEAEQKAEMNKEVSLRDEGRQILMRVMAELGVSLNLPSSFKSLE